MKVDSSRPTLFVVHCVDTEGPLEEPLDATFNRLRNRFDIDIAPSRETLRELQRGTVPLNGLEATVAKWLAPDRLSYLSTWADVEEMVGAITSEDFRRNNSDPLGNPYAFTWFVIDVVGYKDNPRRKAAGFHAVWDVFKRLMRTTGVHDSFGWHFHTVPVGNHALEYNTCWTNNDFHEQALARRIIERSAFPSIYRAGGVIERNDLSFWLEQFIPFDFSSTARIGGGVPGSMFDWRHAPTEWTGYHPSFYDYRRPGDMRRWIFRCLEAAGYETSLSAADVESAFRQVRAGKSAILAYSSHDRRDMRPEIEKVIGLISEVSSGYADVSWQFANGVDAARAVSGTTDATPPTFTQEWAGNTLWVRSDRPLFGSIPFLAIEEAGGVFFRDNPTIEDETTWAYQPPRRPTTLRIGIAGATASGAVGISVIDVPR